MTLLNNRYQIIKTLGRGGFGETFLASDTHLPSARKCVIKQLKPTIQSPETPDWLKERFQREAAILEQLGEDNPQIPRLYAYFSEQGDFYLVQEWVEGVTLTQWHEQNGNLSETEVKSVLRQILPVLTYIHSQRIIHRDIKPDNIILRSEDNLPFLIDFGIMKEAVATMVNPTGKTAYSIALGTPGYMSSEQAAGRPVYSSDLYSLGLTAIFLLTGKSPQYLEQNSQTGEIIWRNLLPMLSDSFAEVIERVIAFHPRDRFSSAEQMLAAISTKTVAPFTPATQVISPKYQEITPIFAEQESETATVNPWWQWFFLPILIASLMLGAFILGFNLFIKRDIQPRSVPSDSVETPSPEAFPTPEVTVIPEPDITPTPTLTPEIAPTPTETPTPEETAIPEPSPEITPLYPEPIIPPGAELTPLTPIPEENPLLAPNSTPEILPNPLSPSSHP